MTLETLESGQGHSTVPSEAEGESGGEEIQVVHEKSKSEAVLLKNKGCKLHFSQKAIPGVVRARRGPSLL